MGRWRMLSIPNTAILLQKVCMMTMGWDRILHTCRKGINHTFDKILREHSE